MYKIPIKLIKAQPNFIFSTYLSNNKGFHVIYSIKNAFYIIKILRYIKSVNNLLSLSNRLFGTTILVTIYT